MKDIRQSLNYARYMAQIGWQVERVGQTYVYIRKIPILGAVLKVQRPEKLDIGGIEALKGKYRVFQIVVEPKDKKQATVLKDRGYRKNQAPYLPTKTLELDLTQSKKKLWQNLKKHCRQALRKTQSLNLSTNPSLKSFHESWVKNTPWQRWKSSASNFRKLKKSFGSSSLLLASHNMEAGAIFLLANQKAYYWQAFTGKTGRRSLAQYQILWQGILWAKNQGAKVFDFEGIYDARFPLPSWQGFSHFKKSFGGQEVEYPGCFTKLFLF
jgi:lipid II:glycine glycyltransferase (peptidoglycan interpeptide bridge formation enzyme)